MFTRTTDAAGVFTGGDYIHDAAGNVVMSIPKELQHNNHRIQYRAHSSWDAEYFCEPDDLIFIEDAGSAQGWYLGHQTFSDDVFVNGSTLVAAGSRTPTMGHVGPQRGLAPIHYPPELPADVTLKETVIEGQGKASTVVSITNRAATAKRFTYLYQDAAYHWFPDGAQLSVESIHLSATTQFNRVVNQESAAKLAAGYWQFAGTFHRPHGVISGMLVFDPRDTAGVSSGYVGFDSIPGYAVPTPGFRQTDVPVGLGVALTQGCIFNRFIAMDFGELQPGQLASRVMYRVMAHLSANPTDDALQAWICSKVVAHYGGN